MTVTLEHLRAEFEAAMENRSKVRDDPDSTLGCQLQALFDADLPDKLYTIARDHGLQAAMLYKLSDGVIDPRKEVQS